MTATTSFPHLADALPASPAARLGTPAARPAPRATQRRRRLRVARTLAVVSVRKALLPRGAIRARQRLRVCGAADILTALDVRVEVIGSAVPWPRLGRVVVSDHTGWLGDLSLSTAAPGTPVLSGDSAGTLPVGSVACPVVLRYRTAAGYLAPSEIPRTLAETAAARDLVVEVHRLPARSTAPGPASAA
ncbi:hypothetical protein E4P39_11420 [Blastococcus sp. CT_GayMR19]|uniref:hypothetical protein n=1 Tax=Blastococcus sp. CT_GayMR19 TaxID=2559608 RepID=UPI0010735F35|nr:hypothetical protein [Blastococcus sp. CT_GayMR19]TFV74872.1 hypothetical protein E4P39_11420 [Blastococcus sp. CT_GayMR19]